MRVYCRNIGIVLIKIKQGKKVLCLANYDLMTRQEFMFICYEKFRLYHDVLLNVSSH